MIKTLGVGLSIVFLSLNLLATPAEDYCAKASDFNYFKKMAYNGENHLSQVNQGGLFNGGVCWWHSLFQRESLYLSVFDPSKPKPTPEERQKIVHDLAVGEKVVEIPGYRNMYEFSSENWPAIQSKLEEWQRVDGFLNQKWIESLRNTWKVDPKELKRTMDALYFDVEILKHITWTMIKFRGFGAHAWLVVDMAKTKLGYEFVVIDSNEPTSMVNVRYNTGESSIDSSLGPIALFPGRTYFFKELKVAQAKYCGKKSMFNFDFLRKKLSNSFQ